MTEQVVRILEIGAGPKPQAGLIWREEMFGPGIELVFETLDADAQYAPTHLCDAAQPPAELAGRYSAVLASHVLEHFAWWQTEAVLAGWANLLQPGGELHVIVPSLEWAAWRIVSQKDDLSVLAHLYAGQTTDWDYHGAGFTMRHLRALFDRTGLAVQRARSGDYTIVVLGDEHKAQQHYVMGVKPGEG